jgi:hypothetical protein
MKNAKKFLKIWAKLKPSILISPDRKKENPEIFNRFLVIIYFYHDRHPEGSTLNLTYIGAAVKNEDISVKSIVLAVRKVRNKFIECLDDGYIVTEGGESKYQHGENISVCFKTKATS